MLVQAESVEARQQMIFRQFAGKFRQVIPQDAEFPLTVSLPDRRLPDAILVRSRNLAVHALDPFEPVPH